jgi:hypothetical protein
MYNIPSYQDFLNEGRVTIDKMTFTVSYVIDARGFGFQFIPDSKTMNAFSTQEQVDKIMEKLKKGLPDLASVVYYQSGNDAAGLVFKIDSYGFTDLVTKSLK